MIFFIKKRIEGYLIKSSPFFDKDELDSVQYKIKEHDFESTHSIAITLRNNLEKIKEIARSQGTKIKEKKLVILDPQTFQDAAKLIPGFPDSLTDINRVVRCLEDHFLGLSPNQKPRVFLVPVITGVANNNDRLRPKVSLSLAFSPHGSKIEEIMDDINLAQEISLPNLNSWLQQYDAPKYWTKEVLLAEVEHYSGIDSYRIPSSLISLYRTIYGHIFEQPLADLNFVIKEKFKASYQLPHYINDLLTALEESLSGNGQQKSDYCPFENMDFHRIIRSQSKSGEVIFREGNAKYLFLKNSFLYHYAMQLYLLGRNLSAFYSEAENSEHLKDIRNFIERSDYKCKQYTERAEKTLALADKFFTEYNIKNLAQVNAHGDPALKKSIGIIEEQYLFFKNLHKRAPFYSYLEEIIEHLETSKEALFKIDPTKLPEGVVEYSINDLTETLEDMGFVHHLLNEDEEANINYYGNPDTLKEIRQHLEKQGAFGEEFDVVDKLLGKLAKEEDKKERARKFATKEANDKKDNANEEQNNGNTTTKEKSSFGFDFSGMLLRDAAKAAALIFSGLFGVLTLFGSLAAGVSFAQGLFYFFLAVGIPWLIYLVFKKNKSDDTGSKKAVVKKSTKKSGAGSTKKKTSQPQGNSNGVAKRVPKDQSSNNGQNKQAVAKQTSQNNGKQKKHPVYGHTKYNGVSHVTAFSKKYSEGDIQQFLSIDKTLLQFTIGKGPGVAVYFIWRKHFENKKFRDGFIKYNTQRLNDKSLSVDQRTEAKLFLAEIEKQANALGLK